MIADLNGNEGGDIKKYLRLKNDINLIGLDIIKVNESAQRYII